MIIDSHYYSKSNLSVFELQGSDSLDLLDRISTNSVKTLQENQNKTSILTTEKAKFVDVVHIVKRTDQLFFVCSGDETLKWIDRFVFSEDIQFISTELNCFELIDETELEIGQTYSDNGTIYFKDEASRTYCLSENMKIHNQVDQAIYINWRIKNLIPDYSHEFTDDFIPSEIAQTKYISFRKGCYIGQEVIARLDSYKKINKRLVQISTTERLSQDSYTVLNNNSEKKGKITSIGTINNKNAYLHLAVIHSSIAHSDSIVILENENQRLNGLVQIVQENNIYSDQT